MLAWILLAPLCVVLAVHVCAVCSGRDRSTRILAIATWAAMTVAIWLWKSTDYKITCDWTNNVSPCVRVYPEAWEIALYTVGLSFFLACPGAFYFSRYIARKRGIYPDD